MKKIFHFDFALNTLSFATHRQTRKHDSIIKKENSWKISGIKFSFFQKEMSSYGEGDFDPPLCPPLHGTW